MTEHRLVEFWKRHDMENNVKITLAIRISTQPSTIRIIIDQKQPENMEYFNYLGVPITRTREINSRMIASGINPSAWGHLNPSSYCDVGRLFYGVFKLWSKLQRKK